MTHKKSIFRSSWARARMSTGWRFRGRLRRRVSRPGRMPLSCTSQSLLPVWKYMAGQKVDFNQSLSVSPWNCSWFMKECNASLHLYFVIPVAGEINTKLMYVIKFVIYYECATLNCKQGVLRPYLCQVPRRVLPLRHRPRRLRPHERGAAQGGRASALEQVGARRGQSLSRDDKRQSRYG